MAVESSESNGPAIPIKVGEFIRTVEQYHDGAITEIEMVNHCLVVMTSSFDTCKTIIHAAYCDLVS